MKNSNNLYLELDDLRVTNSTPILPPGKGIYIVLTVCNSIG